MRPRPLRLLRWAVVVVAVLVLWSAEVPRPGGGRLDTATPFAQLLAARPALVLLVGVVALLALWRAWRVRDGLVAAAALLLVAVGAGLQVAPRALSSASGAGGAPGVTVLTANTLASGVRPETIVGLVRRSGADVVALPETNRTTAAAYARALGAATGRGTWRVLSDTRHGPDDDTAAPTSIVVRSALRPVRLGAGHQDAGEHGRVRVRLNAIPGGAPLTVTAVHPRPPAPLASQAAWRSDLRAVRPLCTRDAVVAGDLNATVDHSPLRAVLVDGCRDAAEETGQGLRATWSGGPLGLLRPTIDHVLTGAGWRASGSGVLALPGSDHRAVWARVVRRRAG
jgi:endonuclease/exonuclease/phosphatase (EEP) superfamily protein YafD